MRHAASSALSGSNGTASSGAPRSTLAEALEASLLLYVVDASDPTCHAQLDVTKAVAFPTRR